MYIHVDTCNFTLDMEQIIHMKQKNTTTTQKKAPKKITERYLQNAGTYYLERNVASSDQFRKVLQKRVYKSVRYHFSKQDQEHLENPTKNNATKNNSTHHTYESALEHALNLVEQEVQRRIELGDINDLEFSRNKAILYHKQGNSKLQIKNKLYQKGISSDLIDTVIAEIYAPTQMIDAHISNSQNAEEEEEFNIQQMNHGDTHSKFDREIIRLQMEREIYDISHQNALQNQQSNHSHQHVVITQPTDHQIHRHAEIQAATAYAKKRGFGPFRRDLEKRQLKREKDLQSMIRAGHSYEISKFVLDMDHIDDLFCIDIFSL